MNFQRYAIYYTAPPGPLADFGAAWLGWDIRAGAAVTHAVLEGINEDIAALTETPRKYGFHGTIKPPFRLTAGTNVDQLAEEAEALCAGLSPITLDGLELSRLGSFLALTTTGNTALLERLASTLVKSLDHFRAPASEAELAKRRRANLSDRQEHYLVEWGYPYVMEEFRFHLTLTGRMNSKHAQSLLEALRPIVSTVLPAPFQVSKVALAGEDTEGRFHEIKRFSLGQA